ncbi:MAG: hypothetical protein ACE5KA_00670 [Nitrososphaerales archaeon]
MALIAIETKKLSIMLLAITKAIIAGPLIMRARIVPAPKILLLEIPESLEELLIGHNNFYTLDINIAKEIHI